jgi:hypothetical protein
MAIPQVNSVLGLQMYIFPLTIHYRLMKAAPGSAHATLAAAAVLQLTQHRVLYFVLHTTQVYVQRIGRKIVQVMKNMLTVPQSCRTISGSY